MIQFPADFDLLDYFEGPLKATGVFEDRFRRCRQKFVVDLFGSRQGDQLKLSEKFYFGDGEEQERTWWISRIGDDQYQGHGSDVVGLAQGRVEDASFRWRYKMALPVGRWSLTAQFDDRMYLMPGNLLINQATVTKFGLLLGTVTLSFQPLK